MSIRADVKGIDALAVPYVCTIVTASPTRTLSPRGDQAAVAGRISVPRYGLGHSQHGGSATSVLSSQQTANEPPVQSLIHACLSNHSHASFDPFSITTSLTSARWAAAACDVGIRPLITTRIDDVRRRCELPLQSTRSRAVGIRRYQLEHLDQ